MNKFSDNLIKALTNEVYKQTLFPDDRVQLKKILSTETKEDANKKMTFLMYVLGTKGQKFGYIINLTLILDKKTNDFIDSRLKFVDSIEF